MKARPIARLCMALLLSIAGSAAGHGVEAPLPPPPRGMAVSVVTAREACFIDTLKLPGLVAARDAVLVRPQADGYQIGKLLVEDGAKVSSGDVLAELVRPDWIPGSQPKTKLTAPISGILAYDRVAVGMLVAPRGQPVFRIIRDGEMEVVVEAPLGALTRLDAGQPARITLLDETELHGTIRLVLPEIAPQTQLGQARIKLLSSAGARVGAFATAAIDVGRSCGPTVPLSAVLYSPSGAIVQVVRNDRIETRRVKTGLFEGPEVAITDGLATGDLVVARAGAFLREGDPVRPIR